MNGNGSELFKELLTLLYEGIHSSARYAVEKNRRATFTNWIFPDSCPCNKTKLAEAGFVFVGNAVEVDLVKCFLCDKSLDSWDDTDDPFKEHLKHSPNCEFAKLQKPERKLTLIQYIYFQKKEIVKKVKARAGEIENELNQIVKDNDI